MFVWLVPPPRSGPAASSPEDPFPGQGGAGRAGVPRPPARWYISRMRFVRIPVLLVLFSSLGCGTSEPESFLDTTIPRLEEYRQQLTGVQREDYRVLRVANDGGVLKVDILFQGPYFDQADYRRRTINALKDLQSLVGTEQTLAAWAYIPAAADPAAAEERRLQIAGEPVLPVGMAFYSARTEQTHFKSAQELQQP